MTHLQQITGGTMTTMTHSRKHRPIRALSILDQVTEGEPHTFICYANGDSDRWWYKHAQDGFHHCFIIHWDGQMWLRIERLYGYFYVSPLLWIDKLFVGRFNLEPYFRCLGYTVQVVSLERRQVKKNRVWQILAPHSCVEFVKDFLGISAYFVITPYQLFKHLERLSHG
ncbi:hypothetical protein VPHD456G2_0002 [Vibrio phage D456 g2]